MPSSSDSVPRVDLQIAAKGDTPSLAQFETWVASSLPPNKSDAELTIRIVEPAESQNLNQTYRQKDKPTNVLSFPADLPPEVDIPLLGDLVICADVVAAEAAEQHKPADAHWAHMTVHGTLHLLGYDHIEDQDAEVMEQLETEILANLGFPCPYNELEPPTSPITGEGE